MTVQNSKPLKVLVVDDTVVYRKIVTDVLTDLPGVEVVGTANNGKIALSKIFSLKPDLLTLDIEMPVMNGLELLARMRKEAPDVGAIMLSTLTQRGGEMTMKALELGAFDFVPKPQNDTAEENRKAIKDAIFPMIRAYTRKKEIAKILGGTSALSSTREDKKKAHLLSGAKKPDQTLRGRRKKSEIVAIGISTGGPNALAEMMPRLSGDLGVPILIVQHMPPVFTKSLASSLNSRCALEVKEAINGEQIRANIAFIAPGGKQMKIVAGADGRQRVIRITDDPPENSCKPSADFLFRSVAEHYVGRATGVIMTGMGSDGTKGLELMSRNGATVIAQDEKTSVVYGMPKEAVDAGIVDVIAPLHRIADEIRKTIKHPVADNRLNEL